MKWRHVAAAVITFVLFLGTFVLVAVYHRALLRMYAEPSVNVTPIEK